VKERLELYIGDISSNQDATIKILKFQHSKTKAVLTFQISEADLCNIELSMSTTVNPRPSLRCVLYRSIYARDPLQEQTNLSIASVSISPARSKQCEDSFFVNSPMSLSAKESLVVSLKQELSAQPGGAGTAQYKERVLRELRKTDDHAFLLLVQQAFELSAGQSIQANRSSQENYQNVNSCIIS